jgi:integrase/recombinase XerD
MLFDATMARDGGERRLAGSVAKAFARNVHHLDPETATFAAMLEGWAVQQRTRFLKASTVTARLALVRRFAEFSNEYPWQWRPAEVEAFFDALRSGGRPLAVSTARSYQNALRMFCDYILDARYGWVTECLDRFGVAPVQILHEWNTVTHVSDYEGDPRRRPLTYDEVQDLFDAADSLVDKIRASGRKGSLAAQRDAAVLKTSVRPAHLHSDPLGKAR